MTTMILLGMLTPVCLAALLPRRGRARRLVPMVLLLALLASGCTPAETPETRETTLVYQSAQEDALLCLEDGAPVTLRHHQLLSEATLASLQPGDVLTVTYQTRTDDEIDATGITVAVQSPEGVQSTPGSHPGGAQTEADPDAPTDEAPDGQDETEAPDEAPTDAPTDEAPDEPEAPDAPDVPEVDPAQLLADLTAYFNAEGTTGLMRRQALVCEYTCPAQADLSQLFYNGTGAASDSDGALTTPEMQALSTLPSLASSGLWQQLDTIRLPVDEMEQALQDWFGISLAQTAHSGLDSMAYLPEYDCFYQFHGDTNALTARDFTAVEVDDDGYCYLRYAADSGGEMVCCLYQDGGDWRIVYHLADDGQALPTGAEAMAQQAAQAERPWTALRPAITPDLACAIDYALLQGAWDQTPKDSAFRAEAHDVLQVVWQEDQLVVYAVSLSKAYDDGHGEITEIDANLHTVTLAFTVQTSSGRLCYTLADIRYTEDPQQSDSVFPGEAWAEAAGLSLEAIAQNLTTLCDENRLAPLTPAEPEAFYALCSARDAETAVQTAMDYRGLSPEVETYRLLGAQENTRLTNALVEELLEDPAAVGWTGTTDADYLSRHIRVVESTVAITRNPLFGNEEGGAFLQTHYLCRDVDTGLWRIWMELEPVQLFGYEP